MLKRKLLLQRIAQPEEIVGGMIYLASEHQACDRGDPRIDGGIMGCLNEGRLIGGERITKP